MDNNAVLTVISELTRGGREFHTGELATRLTEISKEEVSSDAARYIANQLVMKKILDRRAINSLLFVYCKRKGANLSASLTVKTST